MTMVGAAYDEQAQTIKRMREALETILRMAKKPMKSWDAGLCIDAYRVEEICEEALQK